METNYIYAILITGDRNWNNYDSIFNVLSIYPPNNSVLIVGDCKGTDSIALNAVYNLKWINDYNQIIYPISVEDFYDKLKLGNRVFVFKANWNLYGLGAGPMRNKLMVDALNGIILNQPNLIENQNIRYQLSKSVIAFHPNLQNSKGTKNCVEYAQKVGLMIYHYTR